MHKVKSPSKNILNQSDQYFSSLTNDYNYPVNCCSMHSNAVAMLWCLDDTHIPYLETWNLFLVTILPYMATKKKLAREYRFCVQ